MSQKSGKRRVIWLHIGHGKTGTTALQQHFVERALLDPGFHYPSAGRMPSGAHHRLFPLRDQNALRREAKTLIPRVIEEIHARPDARRVVLSSEHLCYFFPDQVAELADAFSEFDIRLLYYVRRQDELIDSAYRWKLVQSPQSIPDLEEFIDRNIHAFDFMKRLAPWRSNFRDDQFNVRLYDTRRCVDIVADALPTLGLEPMDIPSDGARKRLSLDARMTTVLEAHDRLYGVTPLREKFIEALHQTRERFPTKDKHGVIGPELRARIMKRYATSNAEVSRLFLSEEDGAALQVSRD